MKRNDSSFGSRRKMNKRRSHVRSPDHGVKKFPLWALALRSFVFFLFLHSLVPFFLGVGGFEKDGRRKNLWEACD